MVSSISFALAIVAGAFVLHMVTAVPRHSGSSESSEESRHRPPRPGPGLPHRPGNQRPPAPPQPGQNNAVLDPKKLTQRERECYEILMALENGNLTKFDVDSEVRYIQHNAQIPDNKAGLLEFVKQGLGTSKVKVIRIYQDGDYVFAHTNYTFGVQATTIVGYDIWRYDEQNQIGEHWDNLMMPPNAGNPSNHTLLDGPVQAVDLDKTDVNKAIVTAYAFSQINGRLRTDLLESNLIQHNPTIGDGVQALTKGLAALAVQGKGLTYKGLFTVMGKGNFVLVMAPGLQGNTSVGLYDMYRVEKGKIAEQWPIVEAIPPRDQWANPNGKFNGFDN